MSFNLNEHKSNYIDEPGMYDVTITNSKDDYTKSSKPCIAVKFETADNKMTTCLYVEAVYSKLYRLALAAGLTEQQRAYFAPEMLIGRRVKINVIRSDKGINVAEAFAIDSPNNDEMPF